MLKITIYFNYSCLVVYIVIYLHWQVSPKESVISVINVFTNTSLLGSAFFYLSMATNIYLDESGDLGWTFDKKYRCGGSSRFLTIAFIICPANKKNLLTRIVKKVYQKCKKDFGFEIKGSSLNNTYKSYVAKQLTQLVSKHSDIQIGAITVKKFNVQSHIRQDSNKLYNYMLRLSLLEIISNEPIVSLIRDNRSIKVKSGNSLVDYLQTELWFELHSKTQIKDIPSDSKQVRNLILADWINNIVWGYYEDNNTTAYNILKSVIKEKHLFFA